jgi:hypothetical protein
MMFFWKSKKVLFLPLAICMLPLFCFCTKEDEKNLLAQQEKSIDTFISRDTTDAYRKNKDTLIIVTNKRETNRIVWNPKAGDTLAVGDEVTFAYIARIFNSGKGAIFSTNLPQLVDEGYWSISIYPDDYGRNVVGVGYYISGLDAGLIGMRAGEYAYIIFTSQYGYGNKELSMIPKMTPLMFEVEIESIIKKK